MLKSHYFRRILGFVVLLAALATSAVIIRYFIENAKKDNKDHSKSVSTDITMKAIHFTENQQNRKKWELFANRGIYDKTKEKTNLEEVRFIVERRNCSPVTVTARHGQYEHQPKLVLLTGNVMGSTPEGMTFETARITYDSASQTLTTKERIKLTDAALTLEGIGMNFYVEQQQTVVNEQVEATIYPGKRKK